MISKVYLLVNKLIIKLKDLHSKFKQWKPIHLCWWFKKHNLPIPPYLIGTAAVTEQVHYFLGADDPSVEDDPNSITWNPAGEDSSVNYQAVAKESKFHIRIQVAETAGGGLSNANFSLYYHEATDNSTNATEALTAADSRHVQIVDSTGGELIADLTAITVAKCTAPVGGESWVNGACVDESDETGKFGLDDQYTEIQWCVQFTPSATGGEIYYFYIRHDDNECDTYSKKPAITLEAGAVTYTRTSDVDGILLKEQTRTSDVDGILLKEQEKALGIDAKFIFQKTIDSYVDAILRGIVTKGVGVDAIFKDLARTTSTGLDVRLQTFVELNNRRSAFNIIPYVIPPIADGDIDTLRDRVQSAYIYSGILIQQLLGVVTHTIDFDIDSVLRKAMSKTADVDGVLRKLFTLQALVDIVLRDADVTLTSALDSILKLNKLSTTDLDSILRLAKLKTTEIDAILRLNKLDVVDLDVILRLAKLKEVDLDSILRLAKLKTTEIDAILNIIKTKDIDLDSILRLAKTKDIDLDAIFNIVKTKDIDLDSILKLQKTLNIDLNSLLSILKTKSIDIGTILESLTLGGLLELYLVSVLRGVNSKSIELAVRLLAEYIKDVDLNAIIIASGYANKIVSYLTTYVFYAPTISTIDVKTSV